MLKYYISTKIIKLCGRLIKLSQEADEVKRHDFFLWSIFKYVRFGDEFIFYIIAFESQVRSTPPGRFKVFYQNNFQAKMELSMITSKQRIKFR